MPKPFGFIDHSRNDRNKMKISFWKEKYVMWYFQGGNILLSQEKLSLVDINYPWQKKKCFTMLFALLALSSSIDLWWYRLTMLFIHYLNDVIAYQQKTKVRNVNVPLFNKKKENWWYEQII